MKISNNEYIEQMKKAMGEHRQSGPELNFKSCPSCMDDKYHFYLNTQKMVFHCFKCNSSGGTYRLGKMLDMEPEGNPVELKLQEIKMLAWEFFSDQLITDPQADDARKWLIERGIGIEWLSPFHANNEAIKKRLPLGFHPGDGPTVEYFKGLGYDKEELQQAGILLGKLSKFAGSIIFVYSLGPDCIGRFKVRKIRGSSSETAWLGSKGNPTGVFGLQLCNWPDTERHRSVVAVEGEFDALSTQAYVLSYDQATINMVSLSGGAASSGIDTLIQNGVKELRLIPDNDKGGIEFTYNCLNSCRKHNISCIVHTIPGQFKDLDEWVRSGSIHGLKAIFDNEMLPGKYIAQNIMAYDDDFQKFDLNIPSGIESARQYLTNRASKLHGSDRDDFIGSLPGNIRPIELPIATEHIITESTLIKEPVNARILLEQAPRKIPMIIGQGLLPHRGYSIMAAYTKMGKTTLVTQMCLSIVSGSDFLNFPIEKSVNIIYFDIESTEERMAEIIRAQRNNWGKPLTGIEKLHMIEAQGLCLNEKDSIDYIKRNIGKTEAELAIIDPIALCIAMDINEMKTARLIVDILKEIGSEMGVSWFLVHHYGKPRDSKRLPIHSMMGSSGWGNFCESFIGLDRYSERRPPNYKRLTFNLRQDRTPEDMCIYFNQNTRLFEVVTDNDNISATPVDIVCQILGKNGKPLAYNALIDSIQKEIGNSESAARRLVKLATEQGTITKGTGKYGKYTCKNP